VAYVRTVRTSSGAVAVQVVWKSSRGSRDIEHVGSAHSDAEVELLKAVAAQRIAAGQDQLPLDISAALEPAALEITSSRMGRLLDAIAAVYRQLGFDKACGKDVVFEQLVTARIIEPTSKQDAARVLAEAGVRALSYRTVKRRLPGYAKQEWRDRLSGACAAAAQLGPSAFEGNRAETKTIIPLVQRFVAAHGIAGVTVIADAGMLSEANLAAIEDASWSFVIGGKLPEVPYAIKQWQHDNPDLEPADGMVLTQPVIMGPKADQRRRTTIYQYKTDRARRSVHAIEQQVAKAETAVAGQAPIKRNRFVTLTGGTRSVNRELEMKVRTLAGWKPYVTNIINADPAWVIGAYHQLWRIEHAFRMSKHDLRARPVYHHKRESIDAHLAVVFAALAISHRIETRTGWTIKKFVRALRRYRTVKINTGSHTLTAEDPLPDDIRQALEAVHQRAH
jgi:hypothetical protein